MNVIARRGERRELTDSECRGARLTNENFFARWRRMIRANDVKTTDPDLAIQDEDNAIVLTVVVVWKPQARRQNELGNGKPLPRKREFCCEE